MTDAPDVRARYARDVAALHQTADYLLAHDVSPRDTARIVVLMRNGLKADARQRTDPAIKAIIEARCLKRYGNALGSTADQLFLKYGSWEAVIEAAARTGGKDLGF